jgi:uncharacterized protein YqeY
VSQPLKERIQNDVKAAMRARDKARLSARRMATAAIKQREVDTRTELDDGAVLSVLDKMIKQRHESLEHFRKAGRQDLVDKESFEIEVLEQYLPAALGGAELERVISAALEATGATSMKDMGKVMSHLRPQIQGRADMGAVSARVKQRLS